MTWQLTHESHDARIAARPAARTAQPWHARGILPAADARSSRAAQSLAASGAPPLRRRREAGVVAKLHVRRGRARMRPRASRAVALLRGSKNKCGKRYLQVARPSSWSWMPTRRAATAYSAGNKLTFISDTRVITFGALARAGAAAAAHPD
jgi:hypothetical protein